MPRTLFVHGRLRGSFEPLSHLFATHAQEFSNLRLIVSLSIQCENVFVHGHAALLTDLLLRFPSFERKG